MLTHLIATALTMQRCLAEQRRRVIETLRWYAHIRWDLRIIKNGWKRSNKLVGESNEVHG